MESACNVIQRRLVSVGVWRNQKSEVTGHRSSLWIFRPEFIGTLTGKKPYKKRWSITRPSPESKWATRSVAESVSIGNEQTTEAKRQQKTGRKLLSNRCNIFNRLESNQSIEIIRYKSMIINKIK